MEITKGYRNNALVIGYDFSEGNDRTSLVVMRYDSNGKMRIVNAFYDEEALDIYTRLTVNREEISNNE